MNEVPLLLCPNKSERVIILVFVASLVIFDSG